MNLLIFPACVLLVIWSICTWRVMSIGRCVSPFQGWMVGLSFFVVLPLTIIVLNGGYSVPSYYGVEGDWGSLDLRESRFLLPYLFVWLNLVLVALTAAFLCRERPMAARLDSQFDIRAAKLKYALLICVGLTVLDVSINVYLRGGIANYFILNWYTRSEESLATYGDAFVMYQFMNLSLQLALTATACLCVAQKMQTGRGGWPLMVALATVGLNMIMSGNRIFVALLLLFIGAAALYHRRYRAIAKMALAAPFLVVAFAVWAQIRGALSDPVAAIDRHIASASTYEGNYVLNRLIDVTEGTNVLVLLNITNDFGGRYPYLAGSTFLKAVTFWIPRSVYPDKPESLPTITARLYEPEADTSINSTIIGEMYANFGPFTLVLMPFITILIFAVDRWVSRRLSRNYLFCTALFLAFAWMARASFSDNVVMIGIAFLFIWVFRLQSGLIVAKASRSSCAHELNGERFDRRVYG